MTGQRHPHDWQEIYKTEAVFLTVVIKWCSICGQVKKLKASPGSGKNIVHRTPKWGEYK